MNNIKKIEEPKKQYINEGHNAPKYIKLENGIYEYKCPRCREKQRIIVREPIPDETKIESEQSQSITVPISEEDCNRLIKGEEFDWKFGNIDIHLELEDGIN